MEDDNENDDEEELDYALESDNDRDDEDEWSWEILCNDYDYWPFIDVTVWYLMLWDEYILFCTYLTRVNVIYFSKLDQIASRLGPNEIVKIVSNFCTEENRMERRINSQN